MLIRSLLGIARRMSTTAGPVAARIRAKVDESLKPLHVELINESHMHSVPKDSETHFKLIVASEQFQGVPLLKRHQMVYALLDDEMQSGVHALSIKAMDRAQLAKAQGRNDGKPLAEPSPACLGGSKK